MNATIIAFAVAVVIEVVVQDVPDASDSCDVVVSHGVTGSTPEYVAIITWPRCADEIVKAVPSVPVRNL
jgi:hypothetical protein